MSVRSFTVFQDSPSDLPQTHDVSDVLPITLAATDPAATSLSTLAAIEKENLHPITGQRAGPTIGSDAKKRKSAALATKVLVPSSKKLKDQPKKTRKPLGSTGKPKSTDTRKSSKPSRSSRKTSPLPPVAEEQTSQRQPSHISISQGDIDSRCYELTVSPLADVSEAYDASRTESQESDVHTDRDQSVEPAIRDYFSPSIVDKDTSNDSSRRTNELTPERKHIHPFTFSSPSPTSERFKQARSSPTRRDSPTPSQE